MKKIANLIFTALVGIATFQCKSTPKTTTENMKNTENIYNFSLTTIDGITFNLSELKGKKIMIVNTASKCGLTPQFEELEKLYQEYKDKNFEIIGFPSNDFMNQDPGTNKEIAEFCKINYGVSFPMMEKITVKGKNKAPIYQYLTEKSKDMNNGGEILWNFQKFLINEHGIIEKVIHPKTSPLDTEIIDWIKK